MEISSKTAFEFKNLYYEYDEEPIISITKLEKNLKDQQYSDVNGAYLNCQTLKKFKILSVHL